MPDDVTRLWFQLLNEAHIIAQLSRAMFEARLPPGFVLPQFAVLNHLVRVRDGQTPQALARAFQVPKTSMTHSLGVLEREGLVAMHANPRDGRSKVVMITDAGRAFREDAIAALAPDVAQLARRIDRNLAEYTLHSLTELRKVLDAMRDAAAGRAPPSA